MSLRHDPKLIWRTLLGCALAASLVCLPFPLYAQDDAGDTEDDAGDGPDVEGEWEDKEDGDDGSSDEDEGEVLEVGGSTAPDEGELSPEESFRIRQEALFTEPVPAPDGSDPALAAEYEAYRVAVERYWRESEEYRRDLNAFVQKEYENKLADIERTYQRDIDDRRDRIRAHRTDAIAKFERFLERYPKNERYAPGVLYRLAVLHYELADEEFLAADPATLTSDYPDFSRSVHYTEELIRRFPDFPQIDGAYYLLGYCHLEMERDDDARDAFLALVEANPESDKAPEALTRIGEYYFSQSQGAIEVGDGEGGPAWTTARGYYERAVSYGPDYAIYDRALYRLAWTEYYNEDYDSMIHRFIDLVEYADQVPEGSSLRQEAIEFMAGVLAEEDWNLQDDVSFDPNFGMKRFDGYLNEGRPFELEVLRVYADTLIEQGRYDFASEAYEALLQRDVCNPENPKIHQAYISALNLDDQRDKAVKVQANLDTLYGPNSEWYACQEQEGNLEAIAYAESMSRKALKFSIATFYTQASEVYDKTESARAQYEMTGSDEDGARYEALKAERQAAFERTATVTNEFLSRYPNDQDSYTYRYILADSYFSAGDHENAATAFEEVRDVSDGRRRRDSANGAIESREILLKSAVDSGSGDARGLPPYALKDAYRAGKVDANEVPTYILREAAAEGDETAAAIVEARGEDKPAKKPMSAEAKALVDSRDKYVELDLDNRRGEDDAALNPEYKYANAMVFYHHDDLDESRKRLNNIIDEHPSSEHAALAAGFVIESYKREGNLDMVAEESGRLSQLKLGSGEQSEELAALFTDMKYNALFEKARQLFAQEQYAEAAYEYERIVNENPDYEDIHLALYNAGVAYERIQRYESAMRLYKRVYTEYNQETEAADALYRVGVNGERFFDFSAAVDSYLELHDSDRDTFREHPERTTAMRQAAVILKYTEEYARAAKLFERYHDEHNEQTDAPDLLFEAAAMYEKLDDYTKMARTLEKFRKNYGSDSEYRDKVLDSYVRQGDYFKARKDYKRAAGFYTKASSLYQSSPDLGGKRARWLAGKAQFELADIDFLEWSDIKLSGSFKSFKKKVDEKKAGSQAVATKFNSVLGLKDPEWSMAAMFRIGSMFHNFATTLENAECPPRLDDDVCDGLLEGLLEAALELKGKARGKYEEVVAFGKQFDVVNDWTRHSLNGLNDIAPKEYPLFEGERSGLRSKSARAAGLMRPSALSTKGAGDDGADPDDAKDLDFDEEDK